MQAVLIGGLARSTGERRALQLRRADTRPEFVSMATFSGRGRPRERSLMSGGAGYG